MDLNEKDKKILYIMGGVLVVLLIGIIIALAIGTSSKNEDITIDIVGDIDDDGKNEIAIDTEDEVVDEDDIEEVVVDDDFWKFIDKAVKDMNTYVNNEASSDSMISKNGYLYSMATNDYVKNDRVFKDSYYDDYDMSNAHMLYMLPNDVREFGDINIREGDTVDSFIAYETPQGVVINNQGSFGGVLTNEQYAELLASYSNEGDIVEYRSTSADFNEIEYFCAVNIGKMDGLDTRYMVGDNEFTVVVTSPRGFPDQINSFLLKKNNNMIDWDVIYTNFHKEKNYIKSINSIYPKFNIDILPEYDINEYTGKYQLDTRPIDEALRTNGEITDQDGHIIYGVGVNDNWYIEYEMGKAFVIVPENGELTSYVVTTTVESKNALELGGDNPPYIILKQY